MSVSVVAYSRLELLPEDDVPPDDHYEAGHLRAYVLGGFERSGAGLDLDRWYRQTPETGVREIGDWSYSGYNRWREDLCRRVLGVHPEAVWADPDAYADRPFFEIINFADNEGTIGPVAAAKLLADFRNPDDRIAVLDGATEPEVRQYEAWVAGLALAADGGMVRYS